MFPNDEPVSGEDEVEDEMESTSGEDEDAETGDDDDEDGGDSDEDDDGDWSSSDTEVAQPGVQRPQQIESGSDSDLSDGQADRCAICLSRYMGQEIGSPNSCDHTYCAECILEWSKNMTTCPVDRLPFNLVLIRSQIDGLVTRKVAVGAREADEVVENEEATFCEICEQSDREDRMLLCDGCDLGFHLECLNPPLRTVPIEEWFCPTCAADNRQNMAEAVDIEDGELMSLLDQQPALVGPRTVRTRLLPRTRQSERVRQVIQRRRAATNGPQRKRKARRKGRGKRRKSKGKAKSSSSLKSSSSGTVKRWRRRRRRRRRVTRKVKVGRVPVAKTPRERIAEQLGAQKILPKHFLPVVSASSHSRMGTSDGGISTLRLFGTRNELIAFDDCNDEVNADSGAEVAMRNSSQSRRRLKSNMALLSHQSLAHQVPSTSSTFDLLGSILSCQTQLQLPSQGIRIERDGSLRINRDKLLTQTTQHPSDPINGPSSNPSQRAPPGSCSTSSLSNDRTSSTSVDDRCPIVDSFSSSLGSSRREETSAGAGGSSGNDGSGGGHLDSHARTGKKKKKVDEEKKKVDDDDIDIYSDIAPGFENEDVDESEAEPINFPGGLEELSLMDGDSRVSSTSGPHPDDNAEVDPAVDSEDDLVIDESVKHEEENAEDEQPQLAAGNEESDDEEEEEQQEEEEEEEEEDEQETAVSQEKELVDEKESPDSPIEDAPLQTEDISSDEQEVEQYLDKTEVEDSNDDDGDEAQETTYRNQQEEEEDDGDANDEHNEEKEDETVEDDEIEAETVEHDEGGGGGEEEEEDEEEEQQEAVEDNEDDLEEAIEEEEEEEIPLEKDFETLPDNDDDIEIIEPVETGNDVEDDDDVIVTEVRKVSNNRNRLKSDHGGRRRERRRSGESNSSRHRRHRSSPHHSTSNSSSNRRHGKSGGGRGGYEEGELYEANAHRFKSSSSSSSKYERKTRDGEDYDRASRVANVSELPRTQKSRHDSRERSEKQLQKEEEKQNDDKHEGRLGDAESRAANQGGESGGEISWKKLSQSSKTRNYRDNRTRLEQHHLRLAERQKRERDRQSNTQSTPPQPPPPPLPPPPVVANISSSSASNSHEKEEKRRDKKHSEHSRRERERRSTSSSNRRESNERRHSDKRKSDKHSHTNISTSNNSVSTTASRDNRPTKQHRHTSSSSAVGRVGSSSRDSGGSHTRDRTKDRRDRKEAKKEKIKRELERIECEEKHRERKRERALAAVSPPVPPPPPLPPSSPPSESPVNASPPSTIESKEVYASGDKIIINVNFGRSKQSDRERSKKRHHQPSDASDEKEGLTKKKRTKYDHYRPKGIQSPPTPPWNPFAPADELEESAKEDEDSEQEVEEEEFIDDDVEDEETRESGSPAMAADGDDEEAEAEEDDDDNSSIQESVEGEDEDTIEPEAGSGSQAKEDMKEEDEKNLSKGTDDIEEGEEENSVYDPFEPTKSPSDKEDDVKRNDAPPPLPPELPPLPPEPAPEDPTSSSSNSSTQPIIATAAQAGVSTTCTSVAAPIKLDFQPPTSVQTPSNINPNFTAPVLSMPPPPSVLPPPPTPITMANIRVPPPNYLSRPPPQLPNFPWQMGAAAAAANILFRPNFLSHPPPPIHTGSGAAAGNATVAAAAATQIRTLLHNQAAQLALLSSLRPALPPQLTLPPLQQAQFAAPTTLPQQTSNLNAGVNGESGKQQLDTTEVVDMDVDSPYSPGDTLDSAPPTSNNNNTEASENKKGVFDALMGTSQSRKENVPARFSNSGGSGGGGGKMRPSSGGGPSASGGKASGNSSSAAHRSHRTKTDSHRKHIVRFEMTGGGAKGGTQGGGGGTGTAGKKDDGKKEVVAKMDESQLKILDELPSSAVEMQVKEKFLKKLNRQERVIEEVKLAVKPYYNRREINKDEYKEILRKSVPKICHNKSGEINPVKIKALVEGYVKKFKYQHKKDAKVSGGKRS